MLSTLLASLPHLVAPCSAQRCACACENRSTSGDPTNDAFSPGSFTLTGVEPSLSKYLKQREGERERRTKWVDEDQNMLVLVFPSPATVMLMKFNGLKFGFCSMTKSVLIFVDDLEK